MMLNASQLQSSLVRQQPHGAVRFVPFQGGRVRVSTQPYRRLIVQSAAEDPDAELEKRLEALRRSKGATPYGQGTKANNRTGKEEEVAPATKTRDYSGEVVFYEDSPSKADLAFNMVLGATVLWLPLTLAAIGRTVMLNYKFTDKRISITTTTPWNVETINVEYANVKDCITIGRLFGAWGDLLITLKDNTKIEMRSADRYLELRKYVLERRDALAPPSLLNEPLEKVAATSASSSSKRGFS